MRVISPKRLREFWQSRTEDARRAETDLATWKKLAQHAAWSNFAQLRQTFASADQVGNCVVFDIGNNRYRLIGRVMYEKGKVYVLHVMDHTEYDKQLWIDSCGCYKPPPVRPTVAKRAPARDRQAPRRRKRK